MKVVMICAAVLPLACATALAQTSGANPLGSSRVFLFEDMPVRTAPNGAEARVVFNGTLQTGEAVGAHETMQPAGTKPPALHVIQHSEIIVVEQGTLEFNHDGKSERVGPGGIIYVAYGTNHFVKNVGDNAAKYVVIRIGGDTKE
jgi:quercetin dioxygenase-like cupin family protein